MSQLTKRKLRSKIIKTSIAEVLSLLDIGQARLAVYAKDEDLVEIAYLVQHEHERAAVKFAQLLQNHRVVTFFNALDCPIPLGDLVEVIVLENQIICKKLS